MINVPNMLIIGAAGRNVGKTEFACELIQRYSKTQYVIGVKITTIKEKNGQCPRGGVGCGVCSSLVGNYMITEEQTGPAEKDTVRMIDAGAQKVFWLRVLKEYLEEGFSALMGKIPAEACVVCESNSARRVAKPGLFLVVSEEGSKTIKESCKNVIEDADQLISFNGSNWDFFPRQIAFKNNEGWTIPPPKAATAIVLAGGKSRRMGQDKSLLEIDGSPMIEHIVNTLQPHFSKLLIGANDAQKYKFLDLPVIPDDKLDQGPLMGIFSCLEQSSSELNFVMACDIPDPNMELIRRLLDESDGYDIVMPITEDGRHETLFAVYRKSITPVAKALLADGKRRIVELFDEVNVRFIPVSKDLLHQNLNTTHEYDEYLSDRGLKNDQL